MKAKRLLNHKEEGDKAIADPNPGIETVTQVEPAIEDEDDSSGSLRRCIVTGDRRPPEELLRFAVDPDGGIVPDIGLALPGRGLWLTPDRALLAEAVKKRAFDRAARRHVIVPSDLGEIVERALVRRCSETIGLARRSGIAVAGFEKVASELRARQGGLLIAASDGAESGRRKIAALAPDAYLFSGLSAAELGAAFGREHVVHAVVGKGKLAQRLATDGRKLELYRKIGEAAAAPAGRDTRKQLQRGRRSTKP